MADEKYGILVEADVRQAHKDVEQLRRELASLTDQQISINTDIRGLNKLKSELNSVDNSIQKLSSKNEQINIKLNDDIYKKIDNLKTKIQGYKDEIEKLQNKINTNKGLLEGVNKDIERLNQLKVLLEEVSQKYEKAREGGNKGGWATRYNSMYEGYLKEYSELGNESELIKKRTQLEKAISSDEGTIKSYNNKILNTQNSLNTTTARAKIYEKQLEENEAKIRELNQQKIEIQAKIDGAEKVNGNIDEMKAKIEEIDKQKFTIEGKINNLQDFFANLKRMKAETTSLGKSMKEAGSQMISFGSNVQELGKSMQMIFSDNGNSPFGRLIYNITQGTFFSAMYRGTAAAMNMISESVSGAVERYDQLNVSINTLHNLGIATKDVKEAQDELTESIEGLPTQMNDALSAVTKFTSINHDVKRSAKLFEAMNNGILAFGGTSEQVSNAVTQYSQIMGSKMDARTLRSFEDAGFTPVLTAIAKKMGMSFSEFRANFTGADPTISLKEFEDALIELNEKGGGGIKTSLQSLAKQSTQTITNAIKLIKTRLIRGGSDIISALNDITKDFTGKSIYENIDTFTTNMYKKLQEFSKYIKKHKGEIKDTITDIKNYFTDYFKDIFGDTDVKELLKVGLDSVKTMAKQYLELAKIYLKAYKAMFSVIGGGDWEKGLGIYVKYKVVLGSILQVLGKIILIAGRGTKMFGGIMSGLENIIAAIKAYKITKLALGDDSVGFFGRIVNRLTALGKKLPIIRKLTTYMQNYRKTSKAAKEGKEVTTVEGMPPVPKSFDTTAFKEMLSKHLDRGMTIAEVAAVGGVVLEWVKVLKAVEKEMPKDFGKLMGNLGKMAVAVGSVETFMVAIGKIGNLKIGKFSIDEYELSGIAQMAMQGGALWMFAKGIGELCEAVPDDASKMWSKMKSLAVAMASLSFFNGVIGFAGLSGNGFGAVLVGLGSALNALQGLSLKSLGSGIKAIASIPKALEGLPDESEYKGLKKKFSALVDLVDTLQSEFGGDFFGNLGDMFKNISQKWKEQSLGKAINALADTANSITKITSVKVPVSKKGVEALKDKIKSVVKLMKWAQTSQTFKWLREGKLDIGNTNEQRTQSEIQSDAQRLAGNITAYANVLVSLGNSAEAFSKVKKFKVSVADVKQYVKQMKSILTELSGVDLTKIKGFNGKKITNLSNAFEGIPTLYDKIRTFSEYMSNPDNLINVEDLKTKFANLTQVLDAIKDNLYGKFKKMPKAKDVKDLTKVMEYMSTLVTKLNDFNSTWNATNQIRFAPQGVDMVESIKSSITGMNQILGAFTENEDGKKTNLTARINRIGNIAEQFKAIPTIIESLITSINNLSEYNTTWNTIAQKFADNGSNIKENIKKSLTGFRDILGAFTEDEESNITDLGTFRPIAQSKSGTSLLSDIKRLGKQVEQFQNLSTVMDSMIDVATKMQTLNQQLAIVNGSDISTKIQTFRDEILALFASNDKEDTLAAYTKNISKVDYKALSKQISKVSEVAQAIVDMPLVDYNANSTNITNISKLIDEMVNKLGNKDIDTSGISAITTAITGLQQQLLIIAEDTYINVGVEMANKVVEGFKSVKIGSSFAEKVNEALNYMYNQTKGTAEAKGKSLAAKVAKGLKDNFKVRGIANQVGSEESFYQRGVTLGNQIASGIKAAMSDTTVTVKYKGSKSKTKKSKGKSNGGLIYATEGGTVPTKGTLNIFKPKGTDTVPAMLTPGEFVIRKRAVDKFGVDFMKRLNNGDLSGAVQSITTTQKTLKNYTKNVTINNSNTVNNYDNRSVSVDNKYGTNSARLKAGRWLRAI